MQGRATRGRVLYAEDDEVSRSSVAERLRREGYECATADDGVAAAEMLRNETFDCLISDIRMLGNEQLGLVQAVQRIQPGLPAILVTGYPSVDSAIAALNLPVIAYLVKPVDFPTLLAALEEALFRRRLLRHFDETSARLQQWLSDLGQIAEGLRTAPRVAADGPMEIYLMVTYRNIIEALMGLKTLMECSPSRRPDGAADGAAAAPVPLLLIDALRDTIGVLEKTKHSFKSRELGDLRHRLEELLRISRE